MRFLHLHTCIFSLFDILNLATLLIIFSELSIFTSAHVHFLTLKFCNIVKFSYFCDVGNNK